MGLSKKRIIVIELKRREVKAIIRSLCKEAGIERKFKWQQELWKIIKKLESSLNG